MQNLDRVHGVERNGQVQVVMRGLAVVDAEAVQQHQRLFECASAQNKVRLTPARATLLKEDRRVLAQQILRRFQREVFGSHRQHQNGGGRLRQRHRDRRAKNHYGLRDWRNTCALAETGRRADGCREQTGDANLSWGRQNSFQRHHGEANAIITADAIEGPAAPFSRSGMSYARPNPAACQHECRSASPKTAERSFC